MFSLKRAVKHALIPFAAVFIVGVVLSFTNHVEDKFAAGEATATPAFFAFLLGLGVSYLVQTRRKRTR